jgi:hypothetical protein
MCLVVARRVLVVGKLDVKPDSGSDDAGGLPTTNPRGSSAIGDAIGTSGSNSQ